MALNNRKWACRCGWTGDSPAILPGTDGRYVVDVLEVMCHKCHEQPKFQGTKEEEDLWWEQWMKRQNEL